MGTYTVFGSKQIKYQENIIRNISKKRVVRVDIPWVVSLPSTSRSSSGCSKLKTWQPLGPLLKVKLFVGYM